MTELDDHKLLAEFARSASESAFDALVARHMNLVYSTALRFTGNPHHAQEITQAVFVILARKAGSLRRGTVLSGWLYQTARLTAANFVKGEIRRQRREQEAYMLSTLNESNPAAWQQIAPLLDDAMGDLGDTDRNAVVLRFFENKTAQQVGAALKLTEAAAHKRVSRALEKLRSYFSKRGIVLPAAALTAAISANAVQAAPVGLALTISTAAALTGTTLATATTATAIKTIAMTTLQKTVITATLAVVAGVGIYEARQNSQLRGEIQAAINNQSEYLQKLQREREDASNRVAWLTDELIKGKSTGLELLKLRGEVGLLRNRIREQEKLLATLPNQRQIKPIPSGYISMESLTFAGYSTPEKAMQSWLWAMATADKTNLLSSVGPNLKKEVEESTNKPDGEFLDEALSSMSVISALRIFDQKSVTDSEVDLTMSAITFGGQTNTMKMIVRRFQDDWKVDGNAESRNVTAETPGEFEMFLRGASNVTIRVHNKGQSLPPPTQQPPTEK